MLKWEDILFWRVFIRWSAILELCAGGGDHWSPAKKLKETFLFLALFTDEKRGKSHLRGFSPPSLGDANTHALRMC